MKARQWTLKAALYAAPTIRRLLRSLRRAACQLAHARRLAAKSSSAEDATADVVAELQALEQEANDMGIFIYDKPHRGIALLHSTTAQKTPILLVVKDTRITIDTYVVTRELCLLNDLFLCERPIPASWYKPSRRAANPGGGKA